MIDFLQIPVTMLGFYVLAVVVAVWIRRRQQAAGRPTVSRWRFVTVMAMPVVVMVAAFALAYADVDLDVDLDLRPIAAVVGVVVVVARLLNWLARGADDRP